MARLNEAASGRADILSAAFKARYTKQNEEFARTNSQQAITIRNLQAENSRLLAENIEIRSELIRVQVQLDRRDRNQTFVENVAATQKKLQDKMAEVNELLKELDTPRAREKRAPRESMLAERSYIPRETPEGMLEAIPEKATLPKPDFSAERRRSSLNFDDIQFPVPSEPEMVYTDPEPRMPRMPEPEEEDREDRFIEARKARRRRDSSAVSELLLEREPKRPVRKVFVEEETEEVESPVDEESLDFRFSKVSQKAADLARKQMENQMEEERQGKREKEEKREKKERIRKRKEREVDVVDADVDGDIVMSDAQVEAQDMPRSPPRKVEKKTPRSVSTEKTTLNSSAATRKALGPKTTNSDVMNSPAKLASSNPFEKLEKPLSTPLLDEKMPRSAPRTSIRDTPPAADLTSTAGRTGRRRAAVSYAEPSLRAKMRREEPTLVDAVKGEGKSRRSTSVTTPGSHSASCAPTPDATARTSTAATPTPIMKAEPREQHLDQQQNPEQDTVWLKLPMPTSMRAEMEAQKEQQESKSSDPVKQSPAAEEDLPPAIITSRPNRRRTSGFVSQLTTASLVDDDDAAATSTSTSKGLRRTSLSSALDAARSSSTKISPPNSLGKSRSNESITSTASDDAITVEKKVITSRRVSSATERGTAGKKLDEKTQARKALSVKNAGNTTAEGKENDAPLATKKEKLVESQSAVSSRAATRRRSIM